jgi:hypothetical protein
MTANSGIVSFRRQCAPQSTKDHGKRNRRQSRDSQLNEEKLHDQKQPNITSTAGRFRELQPKPRSPGKKTSF